MNIFKRFVQWFNTPAVPKKPIDQMTDEELIAEAKDLYDRLFVFEVELGISANFRYVKIEQELAKRKYDFNEGSAGLTIEKRK